MSFNDGQCPECGKRFGWQGRMADMPPCPRCGHQVPAEQLAADEATLDRAREEVLRRIAKGTQ